jgi:hypothetical protein
LSDDEGSEAPSFITARNHFADDPTEGWLGLDDDSRDEDLLKTPTVASFLVRRTRPAEGHDVLPSGSRHKHASTQSTATLKQENFGDFAYGAESGPTKMADILDVSIPTPDGDSSAAVSPVEKPLPPPPANKDITSDRTETTSPKSAKRPDLVSFGSSQRLKKKILWRGKACLISVPAEDTRGSDESGLRLLSRDDVDERLKKWSQEGYDVRGFDVYAPELGSILDHNGGVSRISYPDPVESSQEWKSGNYAVRLPKQGEWEAYVRILQEEKLRALGVSLGDDEPSATESPASLGAMAHVAGYPGLVTSPPIPTSSAASNPLLGSHVFSPHFNQSTNPSTNAGSLASPQPQFGGQHPFYGVDSNLVAGLPYPYQPTPPAAGTFTPQSLYSARQGGVSSTGPNHLASLNSILSPVSPMNPDDTSPFHQNPHEFLGRRDSIRPPVHRDSEDLGHQTRASRAATLIMDESQVDSKHCRPSNIEIAQPTPRGHGHNLSETLQKGLDKYSQADYHLEESIQRQLDEPETDLRKSRWAVPEDDVQLSPVPAQFPNQDTFATGHHRLFGEQQSLDIQREGDDDIDTNPSLAGTPRDEDLDLSHHPWHSTEASTSSFAGGHKSRTSLNVEAKEFNPTGTFSSKTFTFQGDSYPAGPDTGAMFSPNSSAFMPSGSLGGFDMVAPSFAPFGSQNRVFSPRAFTFSAASFNADAPTFNPGVSVTSNMTSESSDHLKGSIFGDVDFTQVSKPTKRSKAIPIVRPDDNEGESDRQGIVADPTATAPGPQPRQKRARRGAEDGDKDVEFATPSPLAEAMQAQASPAPSQVLKTAEGKENSVPEEGAFEPLNLKPSSPDAKRPFMDDNEVSAAEDTTQVIEVPQANNASSGGYVPNGTQAEEEARPVEVIPSKDAVQDNEEGPSPLEQPDIPPTEPVVPISETTIEPATEAISEAPKPEPRKSVLSAFAKPFSFRPSIAEFVPIVAAPETAVEEPPKPEPVKAETEKSQPEKPKTGLFASRYAVISPPASPTVDENNLELSDLAPAPEPELDLSVDKEVELESPHPESAHDSPDEEELNAIMEKLNGDDSDVGVERLNTPLPAQVPVQSPDVLSGGHPQLAPILRSDAPSPSPRRGLDQLLQGVPRLGSDLDAQSQIAFSQRGFVSGTQSPIRQLVTVDNHISDWDDVISSGEDEKLLQRSKFFDRQANDLVGHMLEERLGPIEEALKFIQHSVVSLNSQSTSQQPMRSASADIEHSDADDEDEEGEAYRTISPLSKRDRRMEKMKNAVLEALTAHHLLRDESTPPAPSIDLTAIQDSIADLKALAAKPPSEPSPDIANVIQEALAAHFNARKVPLSEAEEIGAESLKLQVDGLKSMLRLADERAEQEIKGRRDTQEALNEIQKMLTFAEDEATKYRQAAKDGEETLRQLREEKIPQFEKIQIRSDALEKQQESWELTLSELSEKNIALEGTLDEYRLSHDHWKKKIAELEDENRGLRSEVSHVKSRIEDSLRARQSLRGKFERLQDDMVSATRDIARDQAAARKREEELNAKHETLRASYDREVKLREKLESDIGELEQQEREATKLRFVFGQSQQENARLEELVATLRTESHEYQNKAARFEREFNEARESSRIEVQRTRTLMEGDVEAANNQVNYVRAELEAEISRLENQIENVRLDADTTKERYELLLEEARENKAMAIAELSASKDMAMEEQRKIHDRVLNDLRERHARALHNASEDRQRIESHVNERLSLSNEKVEHLQDKVTHLEEKLDIAKSAARAAAQAAQAKGGPISLPPANHAPSPSMSYRKDSLVPEKISPQALRESILVLQDQLQQRETRIEWLEQELSVIDKDAPNKIKEKDTEINWLRELLGVRVDDLQDIITTLSQPSFDQNTVRDAAIRLKANLQMQQQERERTASGGQAFPSLADLAASPRSLPLAAAAAWGNWRKGRESFTSETNPSGYQSTPSKSNNASGFLSGLLTPPSSNVRHTPKNMSAPPGVVKMGGRRAASESRPLRGYNQSPRSLSARQAGKLPVVHQEAPEPPTTPPLLRQSSYDHDAEANSYDSSALMDDGESTTGCAIPESPKGTKDGLFVSEDA